jgi:CheY-like chemotaxis protein
VIAIEDDGPTMDPQTRLSLFESFVQTPASGDEPGPGLAQIYQWVRQWGGDIAVSTRAPQGSIFQVYLPRIGELPEPPAAARPEAVPVPAEPTTPTGKPKTILVVSEESGIRTLLSKILRREGYQVLEAAGLGEAIRMGTETTGQIDLLIADASLPHMTDSVSVTRMRESSPDIKILLLTATSESDEAQALPEGAESLQKPFTLTALVSKARELLAS